MRRKSEAIEPAVEAANTYLRDTLPSRLNTLYTAIRNRAPSSHMVRGGVMPSPMRIWLAF